MDINRSTLNELYQAFNMSFQRGLRSRQDQQAHLRIATEVPSTTARNVYPWLGQSPHMREWLDERRIKQLKAHKHAIENRRFEGTVEVERDAIEDDEFGVYGPLFEEMGVSAAEWPARTVFELLKQGETALGYDEVPFFSSSHPHDELGAVSNLQAGAQPAWYLFDTTRVIKPLIWQIRRRVRMIRKDDEQRDERAFMYAKYLYGVDSRGAAGFALWQLAYKSKATLDATNLQGALQAMRELTNDQGSDLGVNPNLLVVPPALEYPAKELLMAERNAAGATNTLNGAVEIYVTNLIKE